MPTAVYDVPGLRTRSQRWRSRFVRRMRSIGANPSYVATVISFETGGTFDPQERNPHSNAVGLIQWTTVGAKSQGYEREQIARMTDEGQLELLTAWFQRANPAKLTRPIDYYLAVFAPKAVGKPVDAAVYSAPSKNYEQNKNLDSEPKDGVITVGDIVARFVPLLEASAAKPRLWIRHERWPYAAAAVLSAALTATAVYLERRK